MAAKEASEARWRTLFSVTLYGVILVATAAPCVVASIGIKNDGQGGLKGLGAGWFVLIVLGSIFVVCVCLMLLSRVGNGEHETFSKVYFWFIAISLYGVVPVFAFLRWWLGKMQWVTVPLDGGWMAVFMFASICYACAILAAGDHFDLNDGGTGCATCGRECDRGRAHHN